MTNRKTTFGLSIELETLVKFSKKCEEKNLKMNKIVGELIREWLDEQLLNPIEICKVCGSRYSGKLKACPSCALKEADKIQDGIRLEKEQITAQEIAKLKAKEDNALAEKITAIERTISRLQSGDTKLTPEEIEQKLKDLTKLKLELTGKLYPLKDDIE